MANPVQLIYTDAPGSLPASYTLPPGLDLVISSVVARFNGASAAGPFLACLSVYSQDGRLVGRFFPTQRLAVGDTAVVTYAPFLGIPETALELGLVGANVELPFPAAVVVGSSTTYDTTISYTQENFDTGSFFTSAAPTRLTATQSGTYWFGISATFAGNATGTRAVALFKNGTDGEGGVQAAAAPTSGTAMFAAVVEQLEAGEFMTARVFQDSGGNLNLVAASFSAFAIGQS